MKKIFINAHIVIGAGLPLMCSVQALAFEDVAPALYVEGGRALYDGGNTNAWSVGAIVPWSSSYLAPIEGLTFSWDFFASHWHAPSSKNGHRNYAQLGAIATLRYRFDGGNSRWFAEAGLGGTVMNHIYRTPDREFSTAFQFTEALGLGRSFGARGEHELSMRLQHFSNASIKKPNPGANFARLRYLYRF